MPDHETSLAACAYKGCPEGRPRRGRCGMCGARVAVRVPKGGDGTLFVPYPHKHVSEGVKVPCPGRFEEAENA